MEATRPAVLDDDIRGTRARSDPHAFFHRLRAHDPIHWSAASQAWILTGHAEVCAAFKDERLSSDRITPLEAKMRERQRDDLGDTLDLLRGWMVFRDPPVHTRLRAPVREAFKPRSIERLSHDIATLVDDLVEAMAGRSEVELTEALAHPLPALVIADLLGVPREDRERFQQWSSKLSVLVFGAVEEPERDRIASEGAGEFREYFSWLIRRYEADPGDNLVSALIAARGEAGGLPPDLVVGACTMLLFAGHETTTGLLANGMATLLARPDEHERLRRDPSLVPAAVEEFLRYEGPATAMVRFVTETHERGGHELREGARVYLSLAGANRDPAVFEDPDRFDVGRDPNPHVGFGYGLHFCLGAPLARLEARIALATLLRRFPRLRLASDRLRWGSTIIGRRVLSVPLRLH